VQHQSGLPGTVGAEQSDPFAALQPQVNTEQHLVTAGIGERQPAHVERGHRLGRRRSLCHPPSVHAAVQTRALVRGSIAPTSH
jgi:hypothetical protein